MIDLHAHILPGMDDGSRNPEESAQMLRESYAQGVDVIVASSHFYASQEGLDSFLARRQKALEKIEHDPAAMPRILLGAEVAYFDGMSRSEELKKLCIGSSNLLLVEMPFAPWTERLLQDVYDLPRHLGITPVLAHIERYFSFLPGKKTLEELQEEGVLFQSNGEFFLPTFRGLRAMKMLRRGQIHFLGSDCHGMERRHPNLAAAREKICEKKGAELLKEMDRRGRYLLGL